MYKLPTLFLLGLVQTSFSVEEINFNRDIRPILSENCYYCHGADEQELAADLRLDKRERAIEGGAIVPGKPEESSLIERIYTTDPDSIMPPPKTHKIMSKAEKELLERWVKEGAKYEKHWSFTPVKAQEGETIDSLVKKGLEKRGFTMSEAASKETLIRRLSLDLKGLPPTIEEVEEFLNDTSDDAYEKLVNRFLESPNYGERMAIEWLDSVRYADTVGYHGDVRRDATPYRDYVIESFNTNKAFSDFTKEQIAGDLIPNASLKQKIAASYNRLNQSSQEGGIQNKEYVKKYQAERVRTTSTAWLGITVACAECHDHKFDPITIRDFYSMASFFADIYEAGAWNNDGRYNRMEKFDAAKSKVQELFPDAVADHMWFGHELIVPNNTFIAPNDTSAAKITELQAELSTASEASNQEYDEWLALIKKNQEMS